MTYQTDRGAVSRILTEYDQLGVYRDGGFNAISSEAQQAINKLRSSGTNWGNQVYQNAVNQQYNIMFLLVIIMRREQRLVLVLSVLTER